MFNIGWGEWLIVFLLVLLFFGPKRLPEVARSLGKTLRGFQQGFRELKDEVTQTPSNPIGQARGTTTDKKSLKS